MKHGTVTVWRCLAFKWCLWFKIDNKNNKKYFIILKAEANVFLVDTYLDKF